MSASPLKHLVTSFFTSFQGTVQQEGSVLVVSLPSDRGPAAEVAQFLGRDQFRLVFDLHDLTEDTELVTLGSFLVNRIQEFMAARGCRTHLVLPATHRVTKAEMAARLRPVNAELVSLHAERVDRYEVLFVFKVGYLCDRKVEELVGVAADPASQDVRPLTKDPFHSIPFGRSRSRQMLPEPVLLELYNRAARTVCEQSRASHRDLEQETITRLHKDIERINSYYQQLIADLPALDTMEFDRRVAEYEEERQRRRQEVLDNHALQIRVQLLQYVILERPAEKFTFRVATRSPGGNPVVEGEVFVMVDLHTGEEVSPRCISCGTALRALALCHSGHVVCPTCLQSCAGCGRALCSRCVSGVCRLCGQRLCGECFTLCGSCGETVCLRHTRPCGVCRLPVCDSCHTECAECRIPLCASHRHPGGTEGSVACPDCVRSCAGCGQSVARSRTGKCFTCGQIFCAACLHVCAVCEQTFCVAHGGAIVERRLCPKCLSGHSPVPPSAVS